MFNYANDIDIYRQWARVVVGKPFEANPDRPYHCCYIGRKDHRPYRHPHDQVVQKAGALLCHQERVQSVFRGAIGDHGYLLRSPELGEVLSIAEFALAE
jgi:hypothetical protein